MKNRCRKFLGAVTLLLLMGSYTTTDAQTVLEVLKSNGQTSQFAAAIERAGLDDRFDQRNGSFTVFAPSNGAFAKISASEKNNSQLILNHIITGTATKRSLQHMSQMTCLSGLTVEVAQMDNNSLSIQNYPLIESNIQADNGVVHIIDGVIQ
ncbi:Uncaracterized surface protein containing fasciclin (FAS1) repeats [Fodinibius roseus]|uniref:Uncaracterized surface protein containing fasciclin (FAS1) repeats n=1 Tax=Fodinibius roseus TaxID=1194090 RepID=A0A1M5C9B3_9BACT|nr:fasciclin domain-containing protein [Fodinibius roseus]SHF51197.1 Uncaracterized surface protein containing fasciclin (FAS1) repeats [Fodinibius roseus]